MTRRFTLLVVWPLLLLGAVPAPGVGQRFDAERVGCWKGRPLPDCRSFWLVEMQGNLPVVQTSRVSRGPGGQEIEWDAFESTLEWNLGHMVGVAPGWAAGGVVTLGTGSSDALTGLKVRGRRWLSDDVSVELEVGGVKSDQGGRLAGRPAWGFTTDVRLNVKDDGAFFLRYDRLDSSGIEPRFDGTEHPGDADYVLYTGVGLGSTWTLVGSGALGLGYLILLALFVSHAS